MTLRRFLLWLMILLVALLVAGGWYARVAWEEWRQANSVHNLEWQGVEVSLAGIKLRDFSVSQMRDGQPWSAAGEDLSLGWSWHWQGPRLDVLRLGQLTVNVPAWPDAERPAGSSEGTSADLPLWLPDEVTVNRLVLTLPDGLRAEGDLAVSQLSVPDERELVTDAMKVEAPIAAMTLGGWKLREGQANLVIAGKASEKSATLSFKEETHLEFAGVDAPDSAAQLDKVRVDLAGTEVTSKHRLQPMALEALAFAGPAVATAAAIHHPQLHPQSWRLDGRLEGSLETLRLDGRLSSSAGASADLAFSYALDGTPELEAEMTAAGTEGSRALVNTFSAWPEDLEFGEGSIEATLGLSLPSDGIRMQGEIRVNGLGGLFARTAWTGLDGSLAMDVSGGRLDVRTSGLNLDTVNPGIALAKLRVAWRYQSDLERLASGTLVLDRATAELLGGTVRIEPAEWQLSQMPLRFPLVLSDIDLSQLMRVYPAEGLSGSGILRGSVPLRISERGVSIDAGQVEAEAPGGTLKLPAERLRSMAQNNEAMALVVQAMENFHYSVLNSSVDYEEDGKLILGLRLEGSSPDVRDGHPIVLNINLEEDIPALLTSLQLSGRVNEAVTEKVRNLIEKREAESQSRGLGN